MSLNTDASEGTNSNINININININSESDLGLAHPKGMWVLFIMQMLSMMGFSIVFALLVLYCSNYLHMQDESSYAVTAAFNALVFVTSMPAGWLVEKYLGFKKGTFLSIILGVIGLLVMAVPMKSAMLLGLGIFICSNGMSVPCLYVLLGNLYGKEHPKREDGFVLAYIGMNVGSFITSLFSGTISETVGFWAAFIVGAVAIALMFPILIFRHQVFKENRKYSLNENYLGLFFSFLMVCSTVLLTIFSSISNGLMLILGFASLIYVLLVAKQEGGHAKKGLVIFTLLTTVSIIFWTLYSLAPSLLMLFTERYVDRMVGSYQIPTANLSSLNPFFIVTMGLLLSYVLRKLKQKKGFAMSTTTKFGLGTVLMGVGYLILALSLFFDPSYIKISLYWIVLSYFFQTVGELFVGPIGYAMVGELVPISRIGMMMGIWQLSTGIAGALSNYLADYATPSEATIKLSNKLAEMSYEHAFLIYGAVTVLVGIGIGLSAKKIRTYLATEI